MVCRPKELKHKHHITPRYMGGSDDASNLVEVSITCHAMFHYCNYRLWGNWEDEIALNGLSGRTTSEETFRLAVSKSQSGEGNSQYGTRWIYSVEKKQSYRIRKDEQLPEGFKYGRVENFSDCDECIKMFEVFNNSNYFYLNRYLKDKNIKSPQYFAERIKIFVDKGKYEEVLKRKKKERQENSKKLKKAYSRRYRGVTLRKSGKYQARLSFNGENIYLGSYTTPEEAARVYNKEALKIHGEKAKLNLDID